MQWTSEEDVLLHEGIVSIIQLKAKEGADSNNLSYFQKLFGYGKWEMISGHVKTRTSEQCMKRAHQSQKHFSV